MIQRKEDEELNPNLGEINLDLGSYSLRSDVADLHIPIRRSEATTMQIRQMPSSHSPTPRAGAQPEASAPRNSARDKWPESEIGEL